jgi:hypothetical protein
VSMSSSLKNEIEVWDLNLEGMSIVLFFVSSSLKIEIEGYEYISIPVSSSLKH